MKRTPYNVTEDATMLCETLLEADPSSFDPEAEITRLATFTCPECDSTNTSQPDEEGLVDCMNCGIWFAPYPPRNRHALSATRGPGQRDESIDAPNPDPQTPEEFQAYIDKYGAGPPRKAIKDIQTKSDYREYQRRVADFFRDEGIENLSQDSDENGNPVEPYFSWTPCACCHRNLGGDRYDCSGYNRTTGEVQDGYSVCVDCWYYAEYGTLDDTTMMNLKDDPKPESPAQ